MQSPSLPGCLCALLSVLIETYWNVKEAHFPRSVLSGTRINRNILECKGNRSESAVQRRSVLIETYWNVKTTGATGYYPVKIVLIETYWNVKVNPSCFIFLNAIVLIETYWNVKTDMYKKYAEQL